MATTKDAERVQRITKLDHPKYSTNLRAFLKRWNKERSKFYGAPQVVVSHNKTKMIGAFTQEGDFVGSRVGTVLGRGARSTVGSYAKSKSWKPIKGFWAAYERLGVCVLDKDHSWYWERWDEKKNRRTCKWCGREERLVTVVKRERVWRPNKAS